MFDFCGVWGNPGSDGINPVTGESIRVSRYVAST